METMRLGIEWLSMGIAMSVTVQQRQGEDELWHSIDFLRSGTVLLSMSMVLIRANQSGKASAK